MSVCKMDAKTCNLFVDYYNTLVDRSDRVEVLNLTSIGECIKLVYHMYIKAQESRTNDDKLVLYLKIVKYVSNLTDHPTWSTVNKKQKEKMEQISGWAYNNAMFVKMKIMFRFIRGGKMENSKRVLDRSATVCHPKSQVFLDGDRREMAPDSQPLDIPLTNISRPESRPTAKSCSDTEEVFLDGDDRPSMARATPRRAMGPDSQLLDIPLTFSRCQSSRPTAKSCDTEEVFPDGDRPHPQMWRSVSQPSLATFRDNYGLFCSVCEKKKQSLVAKIICTCKLKFSKHTQTNEIKGAHKRYDALLLYCETEDVIGSKLLQIFTANGYNICTIQREKVLGEQITETFTNLILDSSYVIAVVSAELLNDAIAHWVLNRAFDESIPCDYNFLVPIVLDNCELPDTMKTIGSLKISNNNNTIIDELYERLLVDLGRLTR